MGGAGSTALPTLDVTVTLALLWLVAAALGGPEAPAALALDPGRIGSLGDWWAGLQLAAALAAALAHPATRPLALAPATLLAGELGELHIAAARLLADGAGMPSLLPALKAALACLIGGAALAAVWPARHELCSLAGMALMLVAGAAALVLEAAQLVVGAGGWLAGIEEWSELAACSVLAGMFLRLRRTYCFETVRAPSAG
jgi:hypothetical protein